MLMAQSDRSNCQANLNKVLLDLTCFLTPRSMPSHVRCVPVPDDDILQGVVALSVAMPPQMLPEKMLLPRLLDIFLER